MAEEGTELPIPLNEDEGDNVAIPIEPVVLEEVRVHRELYEDRYRLKAPAFTGEEAVGQFIQEFQKVMEIAQWPPRVALLKLRMALRDKAKPYGTGPDIDGIFASLQARFGISAIDARARLQRLRRDPHTPLQEHATTMMRLAQIAFRDLPQANREIYTYDAFVQSINDLGLHQQFLARGITTVKGALTVGEAYLLVSHMHRNCMASCQVDMEPSAASAAPNAETPAVANVTQMTMASKVAQMTDMLAKLVSALAPPNQIDNAREPSGPRTQSPGTGHPFCLECGRPVHFQKSCPQLQPGLNYHGPRTFPPPAGRR